MTSEPLSRRKFIKWAVSSFVLAQVAPSRKASQTSGRIAQSRVQAWPDLSTEEKATTLFTRQLVPGVRLLTAVKGPKVIAAVFEIQTGSPQFPITTRWLCIASERSPKAHSVQVTADAMAISTAFNPVEVSLSVTDDGSVEVSEQHVRAHDRHIWKELDGKWHLAKKSFAGNVAHRFVTQDYDVATEQFVSTVSLIESDDMLAMECVSTGSLVELGTYCNGQALA